MSSDATIPSREQVLAYLLGELPAQELSRIDRQLLEDDAFADAFEEARNDLLDAYALGGLAHEQRERVRRALALSSDAAAVTFSRALHRALGAITPDDRASGATEHLGWGRLWRWALPLAASVVLAFGLWWALPRHGPGGAVHEVGSAGKSRTFVLLLQPQVLRGAGSLRIVDVPAKLSALRVQIIVADRTGQYEVRVAGPTGSWRYPSLTPRNASGVSYLQLSLPRARLASGAYRIDVLRGAPGALHLENRYTVSVYTR